MACWGLSKSKFSIAMDVYITKLIGQVPVLISLDASATPDRGKLSLLLGVLSFPGLTGTPLSGLSSHSTGCLSSGFAGSLDSFPSLPALAP